MLEDDDSDQNDFCLLIDDDIDIKPFNITKE